MADDTVDVGAGLGLRETFVGDATDQHSIWLFVALTRRHELQAHACVLRYPGKRIDTWLVAWTAGMPGLLEQHQWILL